MSNFNHYKWCNIMDNTNKQDTFVSINGQTKRDKFVKLAEKRTINAIKAIRIIGKLGNPNAYDYSERDVKKISKALTDEIDAMKHRMQSTTSSDDVEFKL